MTARPPWDPDPLHVSEDVAYRPLAHVPRGNARTGCTLVVVLAAALGFAAGVFTHAVLAAPRSAQTTAGDLSRPSAELTEAPRYGVSSPTASSTASASGRGTEQPRTPSPSAAHREQPPAPLGTVGPARTAQPLERVTYTGVASWMPAKYGRDYLAMREPRGTVVELCGPGGCWTAAVNDYGPSKRIHPDRIADVAVGHWEAICGVPRSLGLCPVSATIRSRP
jgi:hypothetical protein